MISLISVLTVLSYRYMLVGTDLNSVPYIDESILKMFLKQRPGKKYREKQKTKNLFLSFFGNNPGLISYHANPECNSFISYRVPFGIKPVDKLRCFSKHESTK